MKSFAVVSAVVAVAYAQNLIPSGINTQCTDFLTTLNTDDSLSQCTTALTTALSAFSPGSNSNVTPAQITSALNSVCDDSSRVSSSCPESVITNLLAGFGAACSQELAGSANIDVVAIYDVLYSLIPMQRSICSKNDNGDWCVTSGATLTSQSADSIQSSLYTQDGQVVIPNTDAFSENNIPFLSISSALPQEELCVACTRNVLRAYIDFQSSLPYSPGLENSQLLKRQTELFTGVNDKCGETFMSNEILAAGAVGKNVFASSASVVDAGLQSFMAAAAGLVTLAISSAL